MDRTIVPGKNNRQVAMVLVTDQFRCKRLITAGRRLADQNDYQLEVVHVASGSAARNPEAIEYLFQASREQGASMTIHYSTSARPERFLGELIQKQQPAAVVTGLPGEGSSLLQKLWLRFAAVDFYMVDHDGQLRQVTIADQAEADVRMRA